MDRTERFDELARTHSGSVLAYLTRRHHGDGSTGPEDVLAEVLIVAWRRLNDIPEGLERPWLFGVARKCLANDQRKTSRRQSFQAQLRRPIGDPSAEDEALADRELFEALAALKPAEREVLYLAAWEGLGPVELAAALRVSTNAAAVRLSKAKAKLFASLSG
jgi:RNA polymerase sigma-70 factor (ECF subfamily)